MVGTRAVLKLKDVVQRAEQGILDDSTDTESILDMDVDVSGVGAALPRRIAQALTEAVESPLAPASEAPESRVLNKAMPPP